MNLPFEIEIPLVGIHPQSMWTERRNDVSVKLLMVAFLVTAENSQETHILSERGLAYGYRNARSKKRKIQH